MMMALLLVLILVYWKLCVPVVEQRCRDGDMNDFLFWCWYPLVPLLFHKVTSLHPSSFQGNDFPLV